MSGVGVGEGGPSLFTVAEVSALLGVTREAVRAKVRSGDLPAYRLGDGPKSRIRIPSASVAGYLRDAHTPPVERR